MINSPDSIDTYFRAAKWTVLYLEICSNMSYSTVTRTVGLCSCFASSVPMNAGKTPCDHTDVQRSLTGTWAIIELQHAVGQGYKI